MEQLLISFCLGLFGLILGSYAAATVWRLRARELVEEKAVGQKVDAAEFKRLKPLTDVKTKNDRSRCLHCGHQLAWNDLIPLFSWLRLGGRCRYCRVAIGSYEPLMELGMAFLFVVSYLAWPFSLDSVVDLIQFGSWLVACVLLLILFAYDAKWFLLPDRIVYLLMMVGGVIALLTITESPDVLQGVLSLLFAVVILSGLYFTLWLVSKGQWIGFGDVKLGLALALLLADWRLAFITLFAANLIGCLIIIPGMVMGKLSRSSRVPFGPLLITGCIIALLWGEKIIHWYSTLLV